MINDRDHRCRAFLRLAIRRIYQAADSRLFSCQQSNPSLSRAASRETQEVRNEVDTELPGELQ
jgi:hypothetical protein